MSQFFANESVSLDKKIELNTNLVKTDTKNIDFIYEIDKCVKWILENNFQKVCLQFPDYLLADSSRIVQKIEEKIKNKVHILGDTAYESCCIDYTAAKHISADSIIHFGQTCFSKTENVIPSLKIHEKFPINVEEFVEKLQLKDSNNFVVIISTPYLYKIDEIKQLVGTKNFEVISIENNFDITNKNVVYLGQNDRKLLNISLNYRPKMLQYFDTTLNDFVAFEPDLKILKRRCFLIEKIKDSNTIGIVIGTLAVKNYLKIIERIKTLSKIHLKKYYVISVGKPSVAKLANFPEVDVFVVVGCASNEIYENREFYKPIVTPFDLESALNPKLQNSNFTYDFNKFLTDDLPILEEIQQNDVSLLTGNIRTKQILQNEDCLQVQVRDEGNMQISEKFGAGFLENRSWKGLEQNLGEQPAEMATEGRKGIPANYDNEIF